MTRVLCLLVGLLCLSPLVFGAPDDGAPSKLGLSSAEHYLEKFEARVNRARGQPFQLGYEDKEALKKIRALKESWPDHPKVDELFARAKQALIASKGETFTITPEMLAYRDKEKKLVELFAVEAEKQWAEFRKRELADDKVVKAWPAPGIRDVSMEDMVGKYVILEDFEYPTNQFYDFGREFVFVGVGSRGFYYVEIDNREWLGAYEAVKRYRRLVNGRLPEGGKWTIIGRITGLEILVPDAAEKKIGPAHWGWRVVPAAILIPGHTFAVFDSTLELGGRFAGEERLEAIKSPLYTVREIPQDVTPEQLVEIFATAIKEKNYALFLDSIDPNRRKTNTALSRIRYHWDLHQHRFAEFYCHVTVESDRTAIRVLQGFDEAADDEGFFLDESEKATIRERSDPLIEEAEVWTKAWNERGLQYGSEKPHYLRRYGKQRWYIEAYAMPY
jgi:hypothetical protein